jgi:hypothetical protein
MNRPSAYNSPLPASRATASSDLIDRRFTVKKLSTVVVLVCLLSLPLLAQTQGSWEIVRADYGSGNNWMDVTERVQSLVQGDSLNFRVAANAVGVNARRSSVRSLRLQLKNADGRTRQITYRDNQQVNLRIYSQYQSSSLRIDRATYGVGYRTSDVTARLNSQIQNGQINEQVTNQSMGGDPAPQQSKTLTVQYAVNGQTNQVVVNEGDTLRLGNNDTANSGGYYDNRGSLHVNRATYGAGYRTSDVTARLNSQIQNGQINEQVTNQSMGGDPAPQQVKNLTVQYTMNGQTNQVVVNEGDTLRLGNNNVGNNGDYGNRGNGNNGNRPQLAQRVRCESQGGNQRNYCVADTRNGVRLMRTLGNSQCTEGSSWGYNSGSVWVNNGCRADFETQGNGNYRGANTSTTIQNGTELSVRTNETIDSSTATAGQTFSAVIAADVLDSTGAVRIPRGSDAQLVIRNSSADGGNSSSDLVLDVNSLTVAGTRYEVSTGDLTQQGRDGVGMNKRTGVMVGGGAAIGTLIGAIVGGGKGAAIGAGIGAGAGAGTEVLTKGHQVRVPAETLLSFRLDQDLLLRAAR